MKKFVLGSSVLLSLCLSSCGFLDLLPHTSNSEGTSTTSETTTTTSEGTSTTSEDTSTTSTTSEGTSTTSEDTSTTSTTSEGTSPTSETSTTSEESTTSETSISSEESTSSESTTSESTTSESSSEESTSESSSEESTSESTSEEYSPSKLTPTVTYKTYTEQNAYYSTYCPQTGNPKLLVIPVWFNDSSTYITSTTKKNNVRSDIETAYFGTTSSTGWHSVKTYYETDSFNKVSLSGTVSDWYECGQASSYYYTDGNKTTALLTDAVTWYKENQGLSNLKSFDSNSDGYIDGVMLIYASPDSQAMGSSSASNMWAYCTSNSNREGTVNDPQANIFFWASYDFMYSSGTKAYNRAGTNYGNGDTSHCTVDAHTYIHEMGHVFGLQDYYDYGKATKPAGAFSMQDYNIGAHDPYSRYSLGWTTPYVPTQTCTFTVKPIESSGEFVLLSPSYTGSAFDEYILLELYTPTGLNELDCTYSYAGYPKGPNSYGVRIWHIDARLYDVTSLNSQGHITGGNVTTTPTYRGGYNQGVYHYGVVHATGNSSTGGREIDYAGSTLYRENYLVRNNTSTTYSANTNLSSSDLFKTGDTFSISSYKKQFPGSTKFNNGNSINWSVSFDSVTSSGMTITCTLN